MADKKGAYYNNGSYNVFRAAIRYEVTTSETSVTVRCRSWIQMGDAHDSGSNFQGQAYITDSYSSWVTASGYLNAGDESGWLGDISKTFTRTHSDQTVTCSGRGWSSTWDAYTPWVNATVTIPKRRSYTVSYNANGGSGAPSSQTKWYGESLTLSSTKPTRTGYTFKGWATSSSGSVSYSSGGSYTANSGATLYAVWQALTYTVSYNANGGSGAPSSQTKTYGVALTLSSTTPTRTGYSFQGWATSSGGSAVYSAGGRYTANASATLYAVWKADTYAVSYNGNKPASASGSVSNLPSNQTKTYGQTLKLSSATPTLTGYTFKGWATSSSGSVAYAAGANYTTNAAVTLYAVWQAQAPSLNISRAYRAKSTGAADDEATYVRVIAKWSQAVSGSVTVTASLVSGGSTRTASTTASGTSGTAYLLIGTGDTLDGGTAYTVTVTATNSAGTTTKTYRLGTAAWPIDVLKGGKGIAFGKAATASGVADFAMTVRSNIGVTASNGGTGDSFFRAQRTDTGHLIEFGIGTGGINRGIYDANLAKWVFYVNDVGENCYNNTPHKTSSTITVSNCTAATNVCWTNGVMAGFTLTISTLASALASGSYRQIGTLPSGYRPVLANRFPVGGANNATFAGKVFLQVDPNGNVYLFNQSGSSLGTNVALYFSDTYPI